VQALRVEEAVAAGSLDPSFRTALCHALLTEGACRDPSRCCFAHSPAERRVEAAIAQGSLPAHFKTRCCNAFSPSIGDAASRPNGGCSLGPRCFYAHGAAELRVEAAIALNALPANYKTRICAQAGGGCPIGDRCLFAHSLQELRVEPAIALGTLPPFFKTRLCTAHTTLSGCPKGLRCYFAHGREEVRGGAAALAAAEAALATHVGALERVESRPPSSAGLHAPRSSASPPPHPGSPPPRASWARHGSSSSLSSLGGRPAHGSAMSLSTSASTASLGPDAGRTSRPLAEAHLRPCSDFDLELPELRDLCAAPEEEESVTPQSAAFTWGSSLGMPSIWAPTNAGCCAPPLSAPLRTARWLQEHELSSGDHDTGLLAQRLARLAC